MNKATRTAVALPIAATAVAAFGLATAPTATAAQGLPDDIGGITSWPEVGTGGLILRDAQGNNLGSGIGEKQDFEFVECGPAGSGLIKVNQLTRGTGGGWGDLYEGYVKARWAMMPSMFDFCK